MTQALLAVAAPAAGAVETLPPGDTRFPRVYHVLAVDDDALSLTLLSRLVQRMGHIVRKVATGEEAMAVIDKGWPDIVLTDFQMPGADGCAVARHAKANSVRWVPVIMLTGASQDDQTLVHALNSGADDYLTKPVSFPVLQAKLYALARTLELQRETNRQHAELRELRAEEEENNLMAEHLIRQLNESASIADPSIAHWVRAAGQFSGDLVISARTPGGALHVMLADATGHGLSAAISLLPMLKTFEAMTGKGYGLGEIARELNKGARLHLPLGRFIAATLIAVDVRYRLVQVWNGANPPVLLLSDDGQLLFRAPSRHLALGIVDNTQFSGALEQYSYPCHCQAVACSDGLVEVQSQSGLPLGEDGWLSLLQSYKPGERMNVLLDALDMPRPVGGYEDDASVVFVDCAMEVVENAPVPPVQEKAVATQPPGQWRTTLTLSEIELKRLDPVPMLLGFINQMDGIKPHAGNLFLILSELFNNALDHGLLGLDSSIKQGPGGFERWIITREARLQSLEKGSIELRMKMTLRGARRALLIVVKDSGPGFDLSKIQVAQADESTHGRGVGLLAQLCASVDYRGNGNDVRVIYEL